MKRWSVNQTNPLHAPSAPESAGLESVRLALVARFGDRAACLNDEQLVAFVREILACAPPAEVESVRVPQSRRTRATKGRPGEPAAAAIRLRIELEDVEPTIWREIVVPSSMTFERLHLVLQVALGWNNSHLHSFRFGNTRIEHEENAREALAFGPAGRRGNIVIESVTTLHDLELTKGQTGTYLYDFGDGWTHTITVLDAAEQSATPSRSISESASLGTVPCCIAGERNVPPEDCGGPFRFMDLMALRTKKRPNAEERGMLKWLGSYDPDTFNRLAVNAELEALGRAPRSRRRKQQ